MRKGNPLFFITYIILIFSAFFITCSEDPEDQLSRDKMEESATPGKFSSLVHIQLQGSLIDDENNFIQNQRIHFKLSTGEIKSIEWCLYKHDTKTGTYRRLICKKMSKKRNSVTFSDSVLPSQSGLYKICVFTRDNLNADEEAPYSNPTCSRPFRVLSQFTGILLEDQANDRNGIFYLNDEVPFTIVASDKDGIESLHWRIEKKDIDSGEYKLYENVSNQYQADGSILVKRTEYYTFPEPGDYQIIAFSRDRASDGKSIGSPNPQTVCTIQVLGYRTKLELEEGINRKVYLFNNPVAFKIIADDIDGIKMVYWFVSKKDTKTGEFTYLKDTFHQYSNPGEVTVAIEEEIQFSSPGIYRISAFVVDSMYRNGDKDHTNPTVSQTIQVLGYTTRIILADNEPGVSGTFCMNTPIQCRVEASDSDGIGSITWCTYKKDPKAGKYLMMDNQCQDYQYNGETSADIEESISFTEPGTYRIKIITTDIQNRTSITSGNPPVFQTIQILGYRTMITVPSHYGSGNYSYPFDVPVPFEVVAEDVNGLDTVWWCIYKQNLKTGKFELIEESCKKENYNGEETITLTGEVNISEPGRYRISSFSRDMLYSEDLPDHQNPEVLSVPFEIKGYQTRFILRDDNTNRNSFSVKTPILFQIRAKDVDGISSVGWCISKMNTNTGKYDIINGSCQWDYFNGEVEVSVNDEIHFIEPGTYRITVFARDSYYTPGYRDHQNPPDIYDFTITK